MRAEIYPQIGFHEVRDKALHEEMEAVRAKQGKKCACNGKWGWGGYHGKQNCQPN